ncbi:MAG: ATP-binding protein [Candidatus Cloacimonetes bacterium]|nr:ATP-binding protein [Candidatus Cloacimonadota bacterium]
MRDTLSETSNVIAARRGLQFLAARPKTRMVGLGLFYGAPGLGKTSYIEKVATENKGWLLIRLESSDTAKTFLQRLYLRIAAERGMAAEYPGGSTNSVHRLVVDLLRDQAMTIFVDEIDYAFSNKKLLGVIRDLVDETLSEVILVGMQDAHKRLLRANAHYFDRCNYFVKFKALDVNDVRLVLSDMCEVAIDDSLAVHLHKDTGGTLRRLVKKVHVIETIARKHGISRVTKKMFLRDVA